jgi:acetoin:2,6-dichlorophenolindophenol oxidoreductase subunit beta
VEKKTRGILMAKNQMRDIIRKISREHLEKNNGVLLGQCLTAVGWVGNTVPEKSEKEGIVELSMDDTSAGYILSGIAAGDERRPIYVVRYQGFQWFNSVGIINYAAKSKEMWGVPCPVFVRSIGMEGSGKEGREKRAIGPVASACHHGLFYRMPGIPIASPMTPKEYEKTWDHFMSHDDPMYVSEHRRGWDVDYEMEDIVNESDVDMTLFPISSTRLNVIEAEESFKKENIKVNVIHLPWIKPFHLNDKDEKIRYALDKSKYGGLVLDGDFINGVAKPIAYDLMHKFDAKVHALGLEERASGFAPWCDNVAPPSEKIFSYVRWLITEKPENLSTPKLYK